MFSDDDDSQTGFSETQGKSKAELRKTNKPIIEKKRRARINHCLNELKEILTEGTGKDTSRHSKLEKADILELTVKHLQKMQRKQLHAAIVADPAVLHRFKSGFGDCAVEVTRYLSRLACVPTALRNRLGSHLNTRLLGMERLHNPEYPQLVPDPLRLDGERTSAFHFVRATKPTSPPISPMSCDSACDSSTEMETPPRPVQSMPFPTPPSRSASDQDSSPETQKPTVSSTTIFPESLRLGAKKIEPLSIIIDVENYKIGIDASPKRAVDYSIRKLKRPVSAVDKTGPTPKLIKLEHNVSYNAPIDDKPSAFKRVERPIVLDKKISLPPSIPSVLPIQNPVMLVPRSVISHTAESLAQSSKKEEKKEVKVEADTSSRSPKQGSSSSTEMWRPW